MSIVYAHDGVSVYDSFFLENLAEKYNVTFLTFSQNSSFVPPTTQTVRLPSILSGGTIRAYALTPLRAEAFRRAVAKVSPDLLIGCMALTYGYYAGCSRFRPNYLFVWGSDVLIHPRRWYFRLLVRSAIRNADRILVDSDVQKEAVVRLGGDSESLIQFPWVDLEPFFDESGESDVRKRLGWEDNLIVLSIRNLEPKYDIECLIRSIPETVSKAPSVRYLIGGEGRLESRLRAMAKNLGVGDYVHFLGSVEHENVPKLMRSVDVYVSTSLSDGTSASLLEAMACKLPAVVSDNEGNKEWIGRVGANGIVFPKGDASCLADQIARLAGDDSLRKRVGENAYETVRLYADWRKNRELLYGSIEELLER